MRKIPQVSILLPVRDAARTLDRSIASLIGQSFTDWECVAVDDHSRDGSRDMLGLWAATDPRISVIGAPEPGGVTLALESARRRARGALLARQDADDWSHPERLARQVAFLSRRTDLAVAGCLTNVPGEPTAGMRRYLDRLAACTDPVVCSREIWVESVLAHPTALIRAGILGAVGGYRERGWPEDYDLWLRIHRAGGRISNVPEVLYEWTDHPDRLSRRDPRYSPDAFLRCRLHHLRRWLAERDLHRPLVVWGAGRDGSRLARGWEKESLLPGPPAPPIVAFVDIDPRKIGRRRRDRPILGPEAARRALPDAFYLAAVGVAGARELIRRELCANEKAEEADFLCLH